MHTLTFRTKFTFGDHVRFDSRVQGYSGTSKVFAITMDAQGRIDYVIDISKGEYSDLRAGIYEDEVLSLVSDSEAASGA